MQEEQPASIGAGAKAILLTIAFVSGLLCFALAAKLRFVDRVKYGEDVAFWVIGIVIHLFAGIAASRARRSMAHWLTGHQSLLRFWTACGALGAILFGLALTGVSAIGWLEKDRPHRGEGVIAIVLVLVGLGVLGWGLVQAASLFQPAKVLFDDKTSGL